MAACTISDLSFIVSSPLSSGLSTPNVDRVQLARHPVSVALTSTSSTRTGSTYKIPMGRNGVVERRCVEARAAAEGETKPATPPQITLTFLKPAGGEERVLTVDSGDSQLRRLMLAEKIPLYSLYGKIMNCGGAGNCATCLVEIKEGAELLSERTEVEEKQLSKKPLNWRLACQTIVGDKSNAGKVKTTLSNFVKRRESILPLG